MILQLFDVLMVFHLMELLNFEQDFQNNLSKVQHKLWAFVLELFKVGVVFTDLDELFDSLLPLGDQVLDLIFKFVVVFDETKVLVEVNAYFLLDKFQVWIFEHLCQLLHNKLLFTLRVLLSFPHMKDLIQDLVYLRCIFQTIYMVSVIKHQIVIINCLDT